MKNKMISFLGAAFAMIVIAGIAEASNTARQFRDLKLPTQAMIEVQVFPSPIVATTNRVLTTNAGATSSAVATVTTFTAQPDQPRNLTITPTGTTADVGTCTVTVTGTNIFNQTISEAFAFASGASTATTGNKAFKTVTSAVWAANCETGGFAATWIIGVGSKLGVKRCTAEAGSYAWSVFNGAYETTRGTLAPHATLVESNTFTPNGTMDAAKDVKLYFVQNFGCSPP